MSDPPAVSRVPSPGATSSAGDGFSPLPGAGQRESRLPAWRAGSRRLRWRGSVAAGRHLHGGLLVALGDGVVADPFERLLRQIGAVGAEVGIVGDDPSLPGDLDGLRPEDGI